MNWKQIVLVSGALSLGMLCAEDVPPLVPQGGNGAQAAPDNKDNNDGKGDVNARGDRGRGRGNRGPGGQGGQGQGNPGGGMPGFGRFPQQLGPEQMQSAAARMAGVDMDDSKTEASLDTLPYGSLRRFVTQVPIGGVDNFSPTATAYKVEQMYKLTFEQSNSLQTIRDEYKTELKKLQDELTAQQKAAAEKVKELRTKYEQRANDVLTGADKENKQKVDTITGETHVQNAKLAGEIFGDNKDMNKMFQLGRDLRDKSALTLEAAQRKIAELVSPEGKVLIEEAIKQQAEARERMKQWVDRAGNRGGNGAPGGQAGDPVKPPKPPEQNGNF